MKKLLILTSVLLTGGLALPAAAQSHRGHYSSPTNVFVSGYLHCGTPIYSKRVRYGNTYHNKRLSAYELKRYLDQKRRLSAQRDHKRHTSRSISSRSRSTSSNGPSRRR